MDRIWEYRINYTREQVEVGGGTHYYNASNAVEALEAQLYISKKDGEGVNIVSVERYCPYSDKWIDETKLATASQQE
jgi:hypothetical protein